VTDGNPCGVGELCPAKEKVMNRFNELKACVEERVTAFTAYFVRTQTTTPSPIAIVQNSLATVKRSKTQMRGQPQHAWVEDSGWDAADPASHKRRDRRTERLSFRGHGV
jgi:hypothetical protein